MKRVSMVLATLTLFYSACGASAPAADALAKPNVVKINNQVYALLGPIGIPSKENRGYMVNSTIIIGDKGVILVDTGFTDEIGRHLKKAIAGITSKPVTHIINSHHHGDHVLGNSEFPGAEIISAEKCRELVEKSSHEWLALVETLTGLRFPNTKPVPANTVYAENTKTPVTLAGVAMTLWVPNGSHTPGDMMVYLPGYKLLIGGDILVHSMTPSFRDAHVKTWIATLEQIGSMDIKTIVPGHGPLMTKNDVKAMHQRMAKLYTGVEAGYKKGLIDSEIRQTLDLHEWEKMKNFDDLMGMNINRAFLEVEEANF
ncbi:MAG TPA: MBL fold metallo-hydrolase [Gammaproteobacteria bacterium]